MNGHCSVAGVAAIDGDLQTSGSPMTFSASDAHAEDVLYDLSQVTASLPADGRRMLQLARLLRIGELRVTLKDGRMIGVRGPEDGPLGHIIIHDDEAFRMLRHDGDLGMAEAYLEGHWSSPDLTAVIELFALNGRVVEEILSRNPLLSMLRRLRHFWNTNTRWRAKRNIRAHYDLGNAFYERWLDPTMTYSSALFDSGANDLEGAQINKYRSIAETAGLKPGHTVLEIGCGWGGFARFAAAEIGCNVVGLTISDEQYAFARERIQREGLNERVDIRLQDYRDETGTYDGIVSIEMIEAVGERYWPTYFGQIFDRLRPGARAGIQAITIDDDLFDGYRQAPDFIQRYIFPGGMLPSRKVLEDLGRQFDLSIIQEKAFGLDYARTLAEWRGRFHEAWPAILSMNMGFDDRFRRLWDYYLHYCEAGFRAGTIDVRQLAFAKSA